MNKQKWMKYIVNECNLNMEYNLKLHVRNDNISEQLSQVLQTKELTLEDLITWDVKFYAWGYGSLTVFDLMKLDDKSIDSMIGVRSYWILGNQYRDLEIDTESIVKIHLYAKEVQAYDNYIDYDTYLDRLKELKIFVDRKNNC